jgi:hypothetical protein
MAISRIFSDVLKSWSGYNELVFLANIQKLGNNAKAPNRDKLLKVLDFADFETNRQFLLFAELFSVSE